MPKNISGSMRSHLDEETTSLCTCWRITRRDGVELFFTDHDVDVQFEGNTYTASLGYDRSALSSDSSMSVDNLEIIGLIEDDQISKRDLRAGLYDLAEVRVFLVNWQDLSDGEIRLKRGTLGEVTVSDDDLFKVEFRSMTQLLDQTVGEVFQAECRADLGDSRCKVSLGSFTTSATVTVGGSRTNFVVSNFAAGVGEGWCSNGIATFTTGDNAGVSVEIRYNNNSLGVELLFETPYIINVGDGVTLVAGCDKRLSTCRDKFNNVLNFRGEPYVPGQDAYFRYPEAK